MRIYWFQSTLNTFLIILIHIWPILGWIPIDKSVNSTCVCLQYYTSHLKVLTFYVYVVVFVFILYVIYIQYLGFGVIGLIKSIITKGFYSYLEISILYFCLNVCVCCTPLTGIHFKCLTKRDINIQTSNTSSCHIFKVFGLRKHFACILCNRSISIG